MVNETHQLTASLAGFLRFLRHQNFSNITISESRDTLEWLNRMDNLNPAEFQAGLRALLCRNTKDWQCFDELYEGYWHISAQDILDNSASFTPSRKNQTTGGIGGVSHHQLIVKVLGTDNQHYQGGASAQDTLVYHDFRFLFNEEQRQLVQSLIKPMVRRALIKKERRFRSHPIGTIDIRRTLRKSLETAGDIGTIQYKKRKRIRPPIILFIDFSQSMEGYSPIFTLLAVAMAELLPNVKVFAFDTHLVDLNPVIAIKNHEDRTAALDSISDIWKGGTRIGNSLNEFLNEYARCDLSPASRIIICSDASESKDQSELLEAMAKLRMNSHSITWLDPLLARIPESMEPERITQARNALRHYTHHYLPAHSIDSLRKAINLI